MQNNSALSSPTGFKGWTIRDRIMPVMAGHDPVDGRASKYDGRDPFVRRVMALVRGGGRKI